MLIAPRPLPENAHIAILAASSPSELENIREGAAAIERRGHRVTLASNIASRYNGYLAGTDDERAAEINRHFASDADAFFFARGGYGAMRILERLDFAPLIERPRPLVGFSDLTAIHQAMAVQGLASFHGPMVNLDFRNGLSPAIERWFWDMLRGVAPLTWSYPRSSVISDGVAEGELFGGCLALTDALVGTPYDWWPDGGIWFWEEVDEPAYRIDRMLTHLRLSGRIDQIRAVVIGTLKDCRTSEQIDLLFDAFFRPLDVPVVRNLPFGHHGDNLLLPVGRLVRVNTFECTFTVIEPAVSTGS